MNSSLTACRWAWPVLIALCSFTPLLAQDAEEAELNFYWAAFADKADSPYRVDEPAVFLSPRAIDRRKRSGIAITPQDFPPNPDYLAQLVAAGGRIHHRSRWLNAATIVATAEQAEQMAQLPFVDTIWYAGGYLEPLSARVRRSPDMSKLKSKLLPDEHYGYAARQTERIKADTLHGLGYDGSGLLIAVMDGGFTAVDESPFFSHLWEEGRIIAPYDFVDGDTLPWESSSHGTKVLSTMAANQPGVMVGTAPGASYICIKTEDTRRELRVEECHWVAGIEYADSLGADIVNSSLGYTTFDEPAMNYEWEDLDGRQSVASQAAELGAARGLMVITSAGNEGNSDWSRIGIPADAPNAFAVGATGLDGKLASFSSKGPTADRVIKPDILAPGAWVTVADVNSYSVSISSGTSFASPILAGAVACLRQAFPNHSAAVVLDAVRQSGSQAEAPDVLGGYGLADFLKAYELLKSLGD